MSWYKGRYAKMEPPQIESGEKTLFGVKIKTDPAMLDDKMKFIHPDGREDVFDMDANKVLDVFEGAQTLLTCNKCNQLYDKAKKDEHSCFKK